MNSLLIAGMLLLSPIQGTARADSVVACYAMESWEFFNKTRFEPTDLVKDSAMLTKINASALSGLQDVYTALDYLNWAESSEMPHYINANTEISEFSLPSGIDTLPVFKSKAVIIADSIAGMCFKKVNSSDSGAWDVLAAGVKLSASSANKLDSLIVKTVKILQKNGLFRPGFCFIRWRSISFPGKYY